MGGDLGSHGDHVHINSLADFEGRFGVDPAAPSDHSVVMAHTTTGNHTSVGPVGVGYGSSFERIYEPPYRNSAGPGWPTIGGGGSCPGFGSPWFDDPLDSILDRRPLAKFPFDPKFPPDPPTKERTMNKIRGEYGLYEVIAIKQPDLDDDGKPVGKPELLQLEGIFRWMTFARDEENARMQAVRKLDDDVDVEDVVLIVKQLA